MARKAKTTNASAPADEPEEMLESEELEASEDEEESEEYSAASSDYEGDDDSGPSAAPSDDHLVDYSVKSREATRAALNAQIEEFLARGGKINQVDNNVTADPPRKPTSNYGSRPI